MINSIIQFLQAILESAINLINSLLATVTDNLEEVINSLIQLLQSLLQSITAFLTSLIPIIGEDLKGLVTALRDRDF